MPQYPSSIPSTANIIRSGNQDGAGGGLAHGPYDDQVLAEIGAIAADLVGTGDGAGLKAGFASLLDRLTDSHIEEVNYVPIATTSYTFAHNLGSRYVAVVVWDRDNNQVAVPAYTANTDNAVTVDVVGLPFNSGDDLSIYVKRL